MAISNKSPNPKDLKYVPTLFTLLTSETFLNNPGAISNVSANNIKLEMVQNTIFFIVEILKVIPFIGGLVSFATILIALGLLIVAIFRKNVEPKEVKIEE